MPERLSSYVYCNTRDLRARFTGALSYGFGEAPIRAAARHGEDSELVGARLFRCWARAHHRQQADAGDGLRGRARGPARLDGEGRADALHRLALPSAPPALRP